MKISLKTILWFAGSLLILAGLFFVPAGTLDYWQAWIYLTVLIIPMLFVVAYFLKNDPAFLERRLKMKEKEIEQQMIQKLGMPLFLIGFLLPAFGKRFGWLDVPAELSLAAAGLVLLGYLFIFWVFRVNSWAGRTIRVEKGQKVISTGPYSVIRHPMYVGAIVMILASPIALGMYAGIIPLLFYTPLLVLRIKNEEQVLRRELAGYKEYCRKVKYRLVPGIW